MQHDLRVSTSELLACFFAESEKQFRFLEEKHGYVYLSGLAEYKNNYKIIVPYKHKNVEEPFLAVTRYEKNERAIELCYGHENYVIDMFIYIDYATRLSMRDLMTAMRSDFRFEEKPVWLKEPDLIKTALGHYSRALEKHAEKLVPPGLKLVDRALTIRGKLVEQTIREYHKKAQDDASVKAAQAFMKKDYKSVIEILSPFADALDAADLKKLKIAYKKLIE